MDWLKDKKNQPIAAAIAAVVILAVVGVFFFVNRSSSGGGAPAADATGASSAMPPGPSAGAPPPAPGSAAGPANATAPPASTPGAPGAPTTPGAQATGASPAQPGVGGAAAAGAKPAGGVQVAVKPMEIPRADPFMPQGYKKPSGKKKKIPIPIADFPMPAIYNVASRPVDDSGMPERPQPPRRMAGLLLDGKVFAIIESNGKTDIVQPGDTLSDRLAIVERIERDKVVLKTTGDKPRYLVVRMASSPQEAQPISSGGPGPGPAPGPPMPMRPPMGPPMPMRAPGRM